MRWLVALVTAWCLLGAGAVRGEVRGDDGRQAQLVAAHGTAAIAARRDGGRHDVRVGVFVVPAGVAGVEPPRARSVERSQGGASVAEVVAPEPVSRGPPRG